MKMLFAIVAVLSLAGCGFRETGGGPDSSKKYWAGAVVREFRLEDGTRCVTAVDAAGRGGVGVTCEWNRGAP